MNSKSIPLNSEIVNLNQENVLLKNKISYFKANYIKKSVAAEEVVKHIKSTRKAIIISLGGLLITLALIRFNFYVGSSSALILTAILAYHLIKIDKTYKYLASKYTIK